MRCAEANRDGKVGTLGGFWDNGAVGDRVGGEASDLDIAFVAGEAVFIDVSLYVVGIHSVGGEADGVVGDQITAAIVLGHDVIGDHSSCLSDVELVGPVVVIDEFVFGQAPFVEVFADFVGHAGAVGERPHEAFLVVFVFCDNACSDFVVAVGVVVVAADVVGGDGEVVVGVGFAVGHHYGIPWYSVVGSFEVSQKQFVSHGVVIFGLWPGSAVFGYVGCAKSEAVCLDAMVGLAFCAGAVVVKAGEQAAG